MIRVINDESELRGVVREPIRVIAEKGHDRIDPESGRFLAASPFYLLATSADDGTCDVSPRGDPPGSVLVLDEHTPAFGDRKGNRRLDSLRNILQRPRVGMLFVVPGVDHTVRVNGRARIVAEAPRMPRLAVEGAVPALAVEVRGEELFGHCGKALARAALWDSATGRARAPCRAGAVRAQSGRSKVPARLLDAMARRDVRVNRY